MIIIIITVIIIIDNHLAESEVNIVVVVNNIWTA